MNININPDSLSSETDIVIFGVTDDQYHFLTGKPWPDDSLGFTIYPTMSFVGYKVNRSNNEVYEIYEANGQTMVYILANEVTAPLISCVVHELGHALGYQGHSYNIGDIMGVAIDPDNVNVPTQLTEDDIAHLGYIYEKYH